MNNFTALTPIEQQKYGIGQLQTVVTGNDMDFSSAVSSDGGEDFFKSNLFVDNCKSCKNNSMKNADGYGYGYGSDSGGGGGGFFSGLNAGDLLQTGGGLLGKYFESDTAQSASEVAQANAAAAQAAIDRQKAENAGENIKNQGTVATIKAYIVPISIVGGLVILGIATYFIFKKKKIN